MNSEQWDRAESIFAELVELPAAERKAALAARGPLEPEVEAEILSLLAAHEASEGYLEDSILAGRRPAIGTRIGPWRLTEPIGEGGMSVVFKAERVEGGYTQTAAIKVIALPALLTEEQARMILQRFEAERQIIARLDHPNICKLLDGGIAPGGLPYLVLEYIEGRDLVEFSGGLPAAARVELLITVSQAVHHAHQRLVVHRDLKPSNILVTADGNPRLLDFGIAKPLDPEEWKLPGDRTVTRLRAATPAFASPEQLRGDAITTGSDIYSLGVILQRLFPDGLSGDLAAIAAKATREEPADRYASAADFAADLRRHLQHVPVDARQSNLRYVAGRFVRRNFAAVVGAAVVLALTVGFAVVTSIQNTRIAAERQRAETVADFLQGLFQASDPAVNQGNRLSTRELLDEGARSIRSRALDEETRLRLMDTIAQAYSGLGLYQQANAIYADSIARYEKIDGGPSVRLARASGALALGTAQLGGHAEADRWSAKALAAARALRPQDPAVLAVVLEQRCLVFYHAANYGPAVPFCAEAAQLARESSLAIPVKARILCSHGRLLRYTNAFAEAEKVLLEALGLIDDVDPASATTLEEIGGLYFREGKLNEAAEAFERSIAMQRKLYPDGHLSLARSLNNLANVYATIRDYDRADRVYLDAHVLYRKFLGEDSGELASSLSNLAVNRQAAGRMDEAAEALRTVMSMHERATGRKRPYWTAALKYAILRLEQGRSAEAADLAAGIVRAFDAMTPPPDMERGMARVVQSAGLIESGRAEAALEPATAGRVLLEKTVAPTHWMRHFADTAVGGALAGTGRRDEARKLLEPLRELYTDRKDRIGWRVLWFRKLWSRYFG